MRYVQRKAVRNAPFGNPHPDAYGPCQMPECRRSNAGYFHPAYGYICGPHWEKVRHQPKLPRPER